MTKAMKRFGDEIATALIENNLETLNRMGAEIRVDSNTASGKTAYRGIDNGGWAFDTNGEIAFVIRSLNLGWIAAGEKGIVTASTLNAAKAAYTAL